MRSGTRTTTCIYIRKPKQKGKKNKGRKRGWPPPPPRYSRNDIVRKELMTQTLLAEMTRK